MAMYTCMYIQIYIYVYTILSRALPDAFSLVLSRPAVPPIDRWKCTRARTFLREQRTQAQRRTFELRSYSSIRDTAES